MAFLTPSCYFFLSLYERKAGTAETCRHILKARRFLIAKRKGLNVLRSILKRTKSSPNH